MIFNFALRPLKEVIPWGPNRRLHWFGLTDGWYWLQVGDAILFEYTQAILNVWSLPISEPFSRYADYQVARLWEDLRDLLPAALEAIPADILEQSPFVEKVWDYIERGEGPDIFDPFYDVVETATNWWGMRGLSRGHLVASPHIEIWRVADVMHVGWNNRQCLVDGVQVWTATSGVVEFPFESFLVETKSFRDRVASFDAGTCQRNPKCERIDGHPN